MSLENKLSNKTGLDTLGGLTFRLGGTLGGAVTAFNMLKTAGYSALPLYAGAVAAGFAGYFAGGLLYNGLKTLFS